MKKLSNVMLISHINESKQTFVDDDRMVFILEEFRKFAILNEYDVSLTPKEADLVSYVCNNVIGKGINGTDEVLEVIELVLWVIDEASRSQFVKAFWDIVSNEEFKLKQKVTKTLFRALFKAIVRCQNTYPNLREEEIDIDNTVDTAVFIINCEINTENSVLKILEQRFKKVMV